MARTADRHNKVANVAKKIVWYVAFYIRLSREDKRNLQESESITNQKLILNDWLSNISIADDEEYVFVDYYVDDGVSGTTDEERPDFQRLLGSIEAGAVNCVVVKNLSRSFRNLTDQSYYLEEYFLIKNIRFVSLYNQTMDTYRNKRIANDMGVKFQGMSNEAFVQQTSESIRMTFDTKRKNGEFIGAFAPYGYLKDPEDKNHLILDPPICELKREMRNWIVHESLSFRGVAKRLNERGVPNPSAYKRSLGWKYNNPQIKKNDGLWEGQTVKRVLLDPVNLGHMVQGRQRVVSYKIHDKIRVPEDEWFIKENTHDPTFTQEEFAELEAIAMRDVRTPNSTKKVHLFAGFLRCPDCDKALQRRTSKNIVYYACRTYKEKSKDACTKHTIRLDVLEEAVLTSIKSQIQLIDGTAQAVEEINQRPEIATQAERLETLIKARQQELDKIQNAADRLYIDWTANEITTGDHKRMKAKFDGQIEQIAQIIEGLEEEQRIAKKGVTTENELFLHFLEFRNIEKLDRGLLIALVDTIFVHEDKAITIRFKYEDQFQRILDYIEVNNEKEPTVEESAS